jgi:hypothetical protein
MSHRLSPSAGIGREKNALFGGFWPLADWQLSNGKWNKKTLMPADPYVDCDAIQARHDLLQPDWAPEWTVRLGEVMGKRPTCADLDRVPRSGSHNEGDQGTRPRMLMFLQS